MSHTRISLTSESLQHKETPMSASPSRVRPHLVHTHSRAGGVA